MKQRANTSWFNLNLNGRTDFAVYSFTGRETVCKPYEFAVEVVHPSSREDITSQRIRNTDRSSSFCRWSSPSILRHRGKNR